MAYFIRIQLGFNLRGILVFLLVLWMAASSVSARAQIHPLLGCNMSGTSPANFQGTYTYGISATCSPSTASSWSVSCGHIVSHTGTTVTVIFDQTGCSTSVVSALNSSGGVIVSETVTISASGPPPPPALDPGAITNPNQSTINYGTTPLSLTGTDASGGTCSGAYTYQWYSSTDGGGSLAIPGQTGTGCTPGPLFATTHFYRAVICGSQTLNSNPVTISVWPQIIPGTITPANQTINNNGIPSTLNISGSTGGNGSYSYQWQSSSDSLFTNPSNVGTDSQSYSPPALTAMTYYRVGVTSNGATVYSGYVSINLWPPVEIFGITPDQTINYNSIPPLLNAAVQGGNNSYGYQWSYMLPGDAVWQSIAGATNSSYQPGALTQTTLYQLQVTSNGISATAGTTVTVYPQLVSGTISPVNQAIAYNTVPATMSISGETGGAGAGSYTYEWYSDASGSFQPVAEGNVFAPTALLADAHFYVVTSSNGVEVNSVTVTVTAGSPPPLPPPDLNYIRSRILKKPGIADKLTADGLTDANDVEQTTTYFDGLGRAMQTVSKKASPLGYDIVVPQVYDEFGREAKRYLPYVSPSSDGNNKSDPFGEQSVFNATQFPGEQYYFGKTDFELSPLDRPVANYSAGNSWVGANKGVVTEYLVNTSDDSVQVWNISFTVGSLPVSGAKYPAGSLYKTTITDEQQHSTVEYKDRDGRVVLKKVQSWDLPAAGHSGWLCTYYVYDDLDNLRFVMPPKAVEWLKSAGWSFSGSGGDQVASELCFRYEYDDRSRMVVKKVPGAGQVNMIYDSRDRLVFTQDANRRQQNQWLSTQYDDLNRPVILGIMTYTATPDQLQQSVTTQTMPGGTGSSIPSVVNLTLPNQTGDFPATQLVNMDSVFSTADNSSFTGEIVNANNTSSGYGADGTTVNSNPVPGGAVIQPLTISYYDNYDWVAGVSPGLGTTIASASGSNFISSYNVSPTYAVPVAADGNTKGELTGSMHLVLGENRPLYTVSFYDDRGRLTQSRSINYTDGIDTLTTQYDFIGKPLVNLLAQHKAGHDDQYHTVLTKMDYDANSRLVNIWKNIDGAAADQLISNLQYDELGQLNKKQLGNDLDYIVNEYNIRGWLTGINKGYVADTAKHYFGMELAYDKTASVASGTSYANSDLNGNIAGTVWRSMGDGANRQYDFTYDNVNRLTGANYKQKFAGGWGISDLGGSGAAMDYSVSGLTYDANGNILSMQQNGFRVGNPTGPIDSLNYAYLTNSNKLLQVHDANNDTSSQLGDFHYKGAKLAFDYQYDANGNLNLDNNKGIDVIRYNILNLPELVHMNGKGNIRYTYDATGNKLTKVTTDSVAGMVTTTLYQDAIQYQRRSPLANPDAGIDTLQFAGHEEGRARWAFHRYLNGQMGYGWEYDFYEKDHLGNTRVLLSQEKDTAQYIATMEAAYRNTEKTLFFGLDTSVVSRAAAGYPVDLSMTNPNDSVTVLNGSGIKQGPAIILKVMSGDKIDLSVRYFYNNAGSTNQAPLNPTDLLGGLANGLMSIAGGGTHGTISDLTNVSTSPLVGALNSYMNDPAIPNASGKPKAYLNYILLDNQFRYVGGSAGTTSQSGALQVGDPGTDNGQLKVPLALTGLPITKSGYLYIYLSNTTEHQDVFFDNLSVIHYSGPMVEENHYYPFGLTMAGISDKAFKGNYAENKFRFNKGTELQNKEFTDGSGLELYETPLRSLDPELGRWWQLDSKTDDAYEAVSPYSAMNNNPIRYNDFNGDEGEACCGGLVDKVKQLTRDAVIFTAAAANAWSSNNLGGAGRADVNTMNGLTDHEREVAQWGQTTGDAGSIITGGVEITGGATGEIASVGIATPVAVPVVLHGISAAGLGIYNLSKDFQQHKSSSDQNTSSSSSESKKVDGQQDTQSHTENEAFRKAKDQNGVPRSAQPDNTTTVPDKKTGKPLKQYTFTNGKGKTVTIRKDNPVTYPDGGSQGQHFNAGQGADNNKLKQHHNYGN